MPQEKKDESIWNGVYERFDQVAESTEIFDSSLWTEKQKVRALDVLSLARSGEPVPKGAKSRDYPFVPFLVGLLSSGKNLSVVDCGGAMGQTYIDILAKIPKAQSALSYTIVETPRIVADVPDAIRSLQGLKFCSSLDALAGTVDVVHCGSVLQYIDDWKGFLNELTNRLQPRFVVLSDLLVGDLPSFVTAQRYYGRVTAVRFINMGEFCAFWDQSNYRAIYRSYYYPLGDESYFPNHELPETHRLEKPCHFILERTEGDK